MKPIAGLPSFPEFANINPGVAPGEPKYSQGFVPADTFPAEWANYLFNRSSKSATALNGAVSSIWAELGTVLTNFNITANDTKTNQIMEALTKLKAEAALAAHPPLSYYWTDSPEHPAVTFGGGTWEQIKDRFILAAGDTYSQGATGGSATVTLTEAQMPVHTHPMESAGEHSHTTNSLKDINTGLNKTLTGTGGGHTHELWGANTGSTTKRWSETWQGNQGNCGKSNIPCETVADHTHNMEHKHGTDSQGSHTHTINSAGGLNGTTQAHDNMPPYRAAYCWKRLT